MSKSHLRTRDVNSTSFRFKFKLKLDDVTLIIVIETFNKVN